MSSNLSVLHRFVARYARSPDHPAKVRILNWLYRVLKLDIVIAETAVGLMRLNIRDHVQSEVFMHGIFEPHTVRLMESLLRVGDCFVDVGANVGVYSLAAARCVGKQGRVLAIEPNPEICADLLCNRRLNNFEETIQVAAVAATEETGLLAFVIPPSTNWGMSREATSETLHGDRYLVFGLPLNELLQAVAIRRIDVIKIDVEGSELRVLRGLFENASTNPPPHILFEFIPDHFSYGGSPVELLRFLEDRRYEILTVNGTQYSFGESILEQNLWARQRSS